VTSFSFSFLVLYFFKTLGSTTTCVLGSGSFKATCLQPSQMLEKHSQSTLWACSDTSYHTHLHLGTIPMSPCSILVLPYSPMLPAHGKACTWWSFNI
jgi:hypothetical protein